MSLPSPHLPAGLRWRPGSRPAATAWPQGGGHGKKSEPTKIQRGPTQTDHDTAPEQREPGGPPPGQPQQPNCMSQMWLLIPMFLILWFLLIRPQQKQEKAHKAMVAALKKGDRVVTNSGMHGTVVRITDDTVVLKLDQEGKLKATFDRNAVGRVLNGGQPPQKA